MIHHLKVLIYGEGHDKPFFMTNIDKVQKSVNIDLMSDEIS